MLILGRMGNFTTRSLLPLVFFVVVVITTLFFSSSSVDTMDVTGSLRDGETLVSAGGRFELGFFSPGRSTKRYLCIRFNKGVEKPTVWVANRERPLDDSAGVLKFGGDGNLVILDKAGDVIWSTEVASNTASNRMAQLLDYGNLVISDTGGDPSGEFLWQSFDIPGNTLLPGMKLLVNTKTGASRRISSWTTDDDPSPGNYSYGLEVNQLPRLVLREGLTIIKFTTGLWNGIQFTGFQSMNTNEVFNSSVVSSGDQTYYTDTMIMNSSLLRVLLHPTGEFERLAWTDEKGAWAKLWIVPATCERYAICGPFGTCAESVSFPLCRCLRGFRPKLPQEWFLGQGTDGCVRETMSGCGDGGVFLRVAQVKLPELDNSSTVSMGMSLEECRRKCAKDCSCTAYTSADVRDGGKGCITWSGGLVDIRNYSTNRQEFYLRVSASDIDADPPSKFHTNKSKKLAIVVSVSVVSGILLLLVLCGF